MSNVSPGVLADAHRVRNLLRGSYTSWDKDVARRKVLRSLLSVQPSLVLDLWGGGVSADALKAEGLAVLSVEDGRYPKKVGLSTIRTKRALQLCAAEAGYEFGWGKAVNFTDRADAAFLDFVGHWSGDKRETLAACRHMKAIAVTLMPERAEFGNLNQRDWTIAYRALLEDATGMRVRWSYPYVRASGLPAVVFFLRHGGRQDRVTSAKLCDDCGEPRPSLAKRFCRECASRRHKDRRNLEADRLRARAYRQEHRETMNAKARERRSRDPEYWRAYKRAEYIKTGRARYLRSKLTAVSGTAAEAISSEDAA